MSDLQIIIRKLKGKNPQFNKYVWVGKEYSIADLIADLEKLR